MESINQSKNQLDLIKESKRLQSFTIVLEIIKLVGIEKVKEVIKLSDELFNFLNPIQKSVHEILLETINKTYTKNLKTRYDYTNFIKKVKDYTGKIDVNIVDFIKNNYTSSSAIKVINVIINYFKDINNQKQQDYFIKNILRDSSEVFNFIDNGMLGLVFSIRRYS